MAIDQTSQKVYKHIPSSQTENLGDLIIKMRTLWCLINVPPLINFRKFPLPGPYVESFINLGKFLFQQLQNIQKYTIIKRYFD